jgi:hypothetical protein
MVACGCGPGSRQDGEPPGGGGYADASVQGGGGDCADGTELVYVIDQLSDRLSSFDPATKTFHDLGSLSCPTMAGASPFSMSVDRGGTAWVLYNSGEMFTVPLATLGCTKTTWHGANGLNVFGMGFSTDMPGGSAESLYVGGGANQMQTSYTLARLDLTTMTARPLGMQPQIPEMTGTGKAELWGFMPEATQARVVQFDRTNGTIVKSYNEPTLAGTMTGYAFAQWGGDFWVFLIKNNEPSTTVYQVDGMTGAIKGTTPTTGRTIVGAGVSTCAPTVVQ